MNQKLPCCMIVIIKQCAFLWLPFLLRITCDDNVSSERLLQAILKLESGEMQCCMISLKTFSGNSNKLLIRDYSSIS